jgi:hypothetical protein
MCTPTNLSPRRSASTEATVATAPATAASLPAATASAASSTTKKLQTGRVETHHTTPKNIGHTTESCSKPENTRTVQIVGKRPKHISQSSQGSLSQKVGQCEDTQHRQNNFDSPTPTGRPKAGPTDAEMATFDDHDPEDEQDPANPLEPIEAEIYGALDEEDEESEDEGDGEEDLARGRRKTTMGVRARVMHTMMSPATPTRTRLPMGKYCKDQHALQQPLHY